MANETETGPIRDDRVGPRPYSRRMPATPDPIDDSSFHPLARTGAMNRIVPSSAAATCCIERLAVAGPAGPDRSIGPAQ